MSENIDFCYLQEIYLRNTKKILDTSTKTGLAGLKTASKKVLHEIPEAAGEFVGNKIADASCEFKNFEGIVILLEERKEILKLRKVLLNVRPENIEIVKRFDDIKVCDKKMDQRK